MDKKKLQLGMNPGTAQHRLTRDLLYDFVIKAGHKCFHCGLELTRETFSIEHTKPWLDSEDPVKNFFDINNIAYSHQNCNYGAARHPHQKYFTDEEKKEVERARVKESRIRNGRPYDKVLRRKKYLRTGT